MCKHCGFIRDKHKIAFNCTVFLKDDGTFGLHLGNDLEGTQDLNIDELCDARDKTSVKKLAQIGKEFHDMESLFVDAVIMRRDEEPLVALIYNIVEQELTSIHQPDVPKPSVN